MKRRTVVGVFVLCNLLWACGLLIPRGVVDARPRAPLVLGNLIAGAPAPVRIGAANVSRATIRWSNALDGDIVTTQAGVWRVSGGVVGADTVLLQNLSGPEVSPAAGTACGAAFSQIAATLAAGSYTLRLRHVDASDNQGEWSQALTFEYDSTIPGPPTAVMITIEGAP
jgi:hypothetical protein